MVSKPLLFCLQMWMNVWLTMLTVIMNVSTCWDHSNAPVKKGLDWILTERHAFVSTSHCVHVCFFRGGIIQHVQWKNAVATVPSSSTDTEELYSFESVQMCRDVCDLQYGIWSLSELVGLIHQIVAYFRP